MQNVKAADVMTTPVIAVNPDTRLIEAKRIYSRF